MKVFISADQENQLIIDILSKVGVNKHDAEKVADVLVAADLRGIKSHGIARLPIYVKRLHEGLINIHPDIKPIKENKGVAVIDGDNGLGQVASYIAMEKCIELAKDYGISIVGLRNSNHFGIAAYYSMMASKNDLIGFVASNTSPLMAPFGGREAMLGTNPFTVAIPAMNEADIVLDMATSLVPRGKVEVFNREGKEAPIGWGINKEGLNTTDPKEILEGTLLPVGGPKGYGMAVIVDILSGLMTGSTYLNDVGSLFGDRDKSQNLGMVMVAIDISNFNDIDEFKTEIDEYINRVRSSDKAVGNDRIFLPGEIEYNNTLRSINDGIEYSEALTGEISELAKEVGVNFDDYIER